MKMMLTALIGASVALGSTRSGAHEPGMQLARMTAASNVNLRSGPSAQMAVLAMLPLGVDLVEIGASADGQWVRVRTADGRQGWVSAPLTKVVRAGERDQVIEQIAVERASASHGFQAAAELVSLVEDLENRTTDSERLAAITLLRLKSLANAARYTGSPTDSRSDVLAWAKARPLLLAYYEPAGRYLLRYDAIMGEHDRHRSTRAAPEIAWFAVTNGIGSDCETDLGCQASVRDRLEGGYLRLYPAGPSVGAALRRILSDVIIYRSIQQNPRDFAPGRDCDRLRRPLAALRAAVAAARPSGSDSGLQAEVLRLVDLVATPCVLWRKKAAPGRSDPDRPEARVVGVS